LATLRALSASTTGEQYPQAMRTEAYHSKNLNAQLGSWSQLRHDNLLYVKPSGPMLCGCSYPAGYVEPLPQFWKSLEELSLMMSQKISAVNFPATPEYHASRKEKQVTFFQDFAKTVRILRGIVDKELSRQPFSEDETDFLKRVVDGAGAGSGLSWWSGWYHKLFYYGYHIADKKDIVIADVFSGPPDRNLGWPGMVLHEGVGRPHLMTIAIEDESGGTCVYVGPVFSYYEVRKEAFQRLTDGEWETMLSNTQVTRPEWCASFSPIQETKKETNEFPFWRRVSEYDQ